MTCLSVGELPGAVFVRNPINREQVATFEIIVSVHDNASEVIDKSGSVPNGQSACWCEIQLYLRLRLSSLVFTVCLCGTQPSLQRD